MVCAAAEIGAFGWACSLRSINSPNCQLGQRWEGLRNKDSYAAPWLGRNIGAGVGRNRQNPSSCNPWERYIRRARGFIIEANIVRDQLTKRDGRQVPQQAHTSWKIAIGPEVSIQSTVNVTFYNPHGQRKAENRSPAHSFWTNPGMLAAEAAGRACGILRRERSRSREH